MSELAIIKSSTLTDIAGAIRVKKGIESDLIPTTSMASEILSISTGVELPELTNPASANHILNGYESIDENGKKITGTIETKTSSDLSASGATVTVPAGYYASSVSKSVSTVTQASPSLLIDTTNNCVKATCTQSSGYVTGGTTSGTYSFTKSAGNSYTPGTSQKSLFNSGLHYFTGGQYIDGDANLLSKNIKSGVSIFGVAGTYKGAEVVYESLDGGRTSSTAKLYTSQSIGTLLCFGCSYVFEWNGSNALWSASGNYSDDATYTYCTSDGTCDTGSATVTFSDSTISVKSGGLLSNSGSFLNGYVAYIPA